MKTTASYAVAISMIMILVLIGGAAMSSTTEVVLNGLHITLDNSTGTILSMSYSGTGTMLVAAASAASVIDIACPIKEFEPLRLAARYSSKPNITQESGLVTIRWDSLGASRDLNVGGKVSAVVTLKTADDGRSVVMTCDIDNKSSNSIRQVLFPDFSGILPFAGEDNTLFRSGGMVSAPFRELKPYQGSGNSWFYQPSLCGKEYSSGGVYTDMITRWIDLGGLKGGLSLYERAWASNTPTTVMLKRSEVDGTLRLSCTHKVDVKAGEKWSSSEFVLTPHNCGWAKGIEPYRGWVKQNLKRNFPVPKHVRTGLAHRLVWMCQEWYKDPMGSTVYFKLKDLPKLARDSSDHGIDEMALLAWNPFFHVPVPPPFAALGTEQDLSEGAAKCRQMGVNLSLVLSVMSLASPSVERYGGKPDTGNAWTYHTELIPVFNPYYANANMCGGAATDKDRERLRADIMTSIKHLYDLGVTSILWDQYYNTPWVHEMVTEIRRLATAKDPESTFASESLANIEIEANQLDYAWNWQSYRDARAYTSVFEAPRIVAGVDWDEGSAQAIKLGFVDNLYLNLMPRKPGGTDGSSLIADCPEMSKALKQCAKLRKQFLPYFTDGTLIGDCILTEPAVGTHITAYVQPNSVLMLVMNSSAAEAPLSFKCDLSPWLKSASGGYEITAYNSDGGRTNVSNTTGPSWTQTTDKLENSDIALYEIRPK